MKKTLEEIAQEKGKLLLYENFTFSIPKENIQTFDKTGVLVESKDNQKFVARAVVKKVPVTRFTKNLNERIYGRDLWQKVHTEESVEGTFCLSGHPEGEGNPKDLVGVWHNFSVLDEEGVADLYLIGPTGDLFKEAIEAGGKNGMSSVGYGEMLEDNQTVNPSTYEPVRLADWVMDPSQQVYATRENVSETTTGTITTATTGELIEVRASSSLPETITSGYIQVTNQSITNEGTNKSRVTSQMKEQKMDIKLQEANFKNQVREILKGARKSDNLVEAREDLQALLENIPTDMGDVRTKVESEISTLSSKLEANVFESKKRLDETTQSYTDLQAKFDDATKVLDELKEENTKVKEVVENFEADKKSFEEKIAKYESDRDLFIANEELMKSDILQLGEDLDAAAQDVSWLQEDHIVKDQDLSQLIKDRKTLEEDIKSLQDDDDDDDDEEKKKANKVPTKEGRNWSLTSKKEIKEQKEDMSKKKTENNRIKSALTSYFERQIQINPAIADIEEEIFSSKSLMEATQKVRAFTKPIKEEAVTLKETMAAARKSSWLNGRR